MHSYLDNERGSVAVPFALSLLVLLVGIGGALDYSRALSTKAKLQAALDAAVISAASSRAEDRLSVALSIAKENFSTGFGPDNDPAYVTSPDGTVSASVTIPIETHFLKLLKIPTIAVKVTAKAASTQVSTTRVAFTPTQVQGWYAKDIYAFVRDEKGEIIEKVKVLSYDYNHPQDRKTVNPPLNNKTQTFTLNGGTTFGMMMRVWPDTVRIGSRSGPSIDYYSDDKAPLIKMSGECKTGQTNSWEDGGNSDYKDFIYTMTCQSMVGPPTNIRLVE